jgi:4-hydroxy-tetrahydrodipicolinate reductase
MSTNIVVCGTLGRMGKEIVQAALAQDGVSIVGGTEVKSHPLIDTALGAQFGRPELSAKIHATIDSAPLKGSVVIDFTAPEATCAILDTVCKQGGAMVIGTTGMNDAQIKQVHDAAKLMPIVFSPNFSMGVNLLFHLVDVAARALGTSFDIEIIEAHHNLKKDAPSGTAKKLGEVAAHARNWTYEQAIRDGRKGLAPRTKDEIGMHAVRGGDITGDHTVLFAGLGERIELKHIAHSRATFARGAVTAAMWLSDKKPGLYTMANVLGI